MLQKIFWQIYQLPIEFLTVIKNDELLIYLGMGIYVIKNSVKLFVYFLYSLGKVFVIQHVF